MKQVQAVVDITKVVLGNRFVTHAPVTHYLTHDDREEIARRVANGISNGEIYVKPAKKQKFSNDKELRKYVMGMINNWFKKSKELNGNVEHRTAKPGLRKYPSDPALREMKKLRAQLELAGETETLLIVDAQIEARIAAIDAEKQPKIDASKLPDKLKKFVKAS